MHRFSMLAASALVVLGAAGADARTTTRQDIAKTQIVAFMDALGKGDREAFNRVTTPNFRAFENGRIVSDRGIFFDGVQAAIRKGMSPDMFQTEERSTIGDNVAAINYVNHGTYVRADGPRDITWLEIVTLQRSGGMWRIDFIDSQVQSDTPAAAATKN